MNEFWADSAPELCQPLTGDGRDETLLCVLHSQAGTMRTQGTTTGADG